MPSPEDPAPPEGESRRRTRPSVDVPPSVLNVLSDRIGEAPRISLREEASHLSGAPVIQPDSEERGALPEGRGSYQVLGEIARGGMGVVLRGHDTDLGRDVAMKVLSRELADRPDVVQRFVEEAQIGGQLQHPGIVPVYELGLMADERPYFTMKLIKGRTLATLLAEREPGAADRRRLIDVFESVCQTMAYAHSRGVIHRDLKPANIMVGAFGEVQVVDWGLAKVLARGGVEDERRAKSTRVERTVLETVRSDGSGSGSNSLLGSVLGTPSYMPPEQASGLVDRLDERADVFALGAILCEVLTGAPPYSPDSDTAIQEAAQGELEPALARLDACDADAELVKIARSCLVVAPAARPRHAGVLAESVQRYLESSEERARAAQVEAAEARVRAAQEGKARRLTLALALSVVATLVLGGGGWLWMRGERDRQRTERERAQARLEREVGAELGEARVLAARGELAPAGVSVEKARAMTESGGADPALVARVDAVREELGDIARRRAEEAERARERERLLQRLAEVDTPAMVVLDGPVEAARLRAEAFRTAFLDFGIDFEGLGEAELAADLARRGLGAEVALFLDSWSAARRELELDSLQLLEVAHRVDPDALRADLREALLNGHMPTLLELANGEDLADQPPATIRLLARSLVRLGRAELGATVLRRGLVRHPSSASLHLELARMLAPGNADSMDGLERGPFVEALGHAWSALALEPGSAWNHFILARIYNQLGQNARAIPLVEKATELDPSLVGPRTFLAFLLVAEPGREEEAVELVERILAEADVPAAWSYFAAGIHATGLAKLGRLGEALDSARRSCATRPSDGFGHSVKLSVLAQRGDPEEVVREFQACCRSVFDETALLFALLMVPHLERMEPEAAERVFGAGLSRLEAVVEREPGAVWLRALLGAARLLDGDAEGAHAAALEGEARATGRGSPLAWFVLAASLAELGEEEQALAWFERGRAWASELTHIGEMKAVYLVANLAAERLGYPPFD